MEKKMKLFKVLAIILIIVAGIFFYQALDKKTNYSSGENYPFKAQNAYVGGDAYNYIINSNYFTGYVILGSSTTLISALLYISSIFIELDLEKRVLLKEEKFVSNQEELPEI